MSAGQLPVEPEEQHVIERQLGQDLPPLGAGREQRRRAPAGSPPRAGAARRSPARWPAPLRAARRAISRSTAWCPRCTPSNEPTVTVLPRGQRRQAARSRRPQHHRRPEPAVRRPRHGDQLARRAPAPRRPLAPALGRAPRGHGSPRPVPASSSSTRRQVRQHRARRAAARRRRRAARAAPRPRPAARRSLPPERGQVGADAQPLAQVAGDAPGCRCPALTVTRKVTSGGA